MLLENLNTQKLLTITSVLGATGKADHYAFRGDLVLKEGELREGSERDRKPPEIVIHQSVVLASAEKFLFVSGLLYQLEQLPMFAEKYRDAFNSDTIIIFYVENIKQNLLVEHQGLTFKCVPYGDGMIWNELLDLLYLEKSDLKGLSAEEKVDTVFDAAGSFDIKTSPISFKEACSKTIAVVKEAGVGPV
jgi:hypothetical protein